MNGPSNEWWRGFMLRFNNKPRPVEDEAKAGWNECDITHWNLCFPSAPVALPEIGAD